MEGTKATSLSSMTVGRRVKPLSKRRRNGKKKYQANDNFKLYR